MSARQLFSFPGGIRLEAHKHTTEDKMSKRVRLPQRLVLPLQQHVGVPARPCVDVGQRVLKGDLIAASQQYVGMRLHAPTSGTISSIADFPIIHPSGIPSPAIELMCDGDDRARQAPQPAAVELDAAAIVACIADAGIVGLGGAGFPSHVKVREGSAQQVDLLIINGVECEPYITCDDRIIREHPHEILAGARLLAKAMNARECVLAIEDDRPAAGAALAQAEIPGIEVVAVPAIYPAGGEKQLITVLSGREIPSGLLPIHIGVAMLNVHTAFAAYQAVMHGIPLIERMVTVAGDTPAAGNYRVPIGMPVNVLLEQLGDTGAEDRMILSGGPMMGVEILDLNAPVTKTVNCILLLERDTAARPPTACIRCGECVPVCPVGLQPQQLYEAARAADLDAAQDAHLFDCIECGCCAYVCPSRIPLVHYYRSAKSSIEAMDVDRADADQARAHFLAREKRLAHRTGDPVSPAIELAEVADCEPQRLRDGVAAAVARARRRRRESDD